MVSVAEIPLFQWPALAGRPLFFTVEAKVLTPLTGLSLAIDCGDGNGFQYDAKMIAYTNELRAWSKTSFQAVMPINVTNATVARFAVDLWGENQASGEAAEAILGSVAVSLVGVGWSAAVAAAGGVGSYVTDGVPME